MKTFKEMTVGEIVAENFNCAKVFDRYGIDFCCSGSAPLLQACENAGTDAMKVMEALEDVGTEGGAQIDFKCWPTDLLSDYILKFHHRNIRTQGVEIAALLDKVCRVHGDKHPELLEVQVLFVQSLKDLEEHLQKEETVLFPYIYALSEADQNGTTLPKLHCGSVENPIAVMMTEHDAEGERYRHISRLTNAYQAPADGCGSYRLLLEKLKAFEAALHQHIHLENNIVFLRTIEMERQQGC